MSKPDIIPNKTIAGIAVDPKTLERVIPESRRPDGSIRKQQKVRPGFTPQEDVKIFRGTRQQQFERNQLPKGHILGWVAPSAEKKPGAAKASSSGPSIGAGLSDTPLSKSAAKNAKRKAKKQAEKEKVIQENWEDSDEDKPPKSTSGQAQRASKEAIGSEETATNDESQAPEVPAEVNALADELEKKLEVH